MWKSSLWWWFYEEIKVEGFNSRMWPLFRPIAVVSNCSKIRWSWDNRWEKGCEHGPCRLCLDRFGHEISCSILALSCMDRAAPPAARIPIMGCQTGPVACACWSCHADRPVSLLGALKSIWVLEYHSSEKIHATEFYMWNCKYIGAIGDLLLASGGCSSQSDSCLCFGSMTI